MPYQSTKYCSCVLHEGHWNVESILLHYIRKFPRKKQTGVSFKFKYDAGTLCVCNETVTSQ